MTLVNQDPTRLKLDQMFVWLVLLVLLLTSSALLTVHYVVMELTPALLVLKPAPHVSLTPHLPLTTQALNLVRIAAVPL